MRPSSRRSGTSSISTAPKPDSAAPNTKKGGYWVEYQPGMAEAAKSSPTTLCTDTTSGAMIAAITPYTAW